MLHYLFLTVIITSCLATAFPNSAEKQQNEPKPPVLEAKTSEIEQVPNSKESAQPVQQQKKVQVPKAKELNHPLQQDAINQYFGRQYSPGQPGGQYGLGFLEPQYQLPGAFPRVQPQIVLYGPGGQGQPILINPGSPPGNFLVPQGGPNVILRENNPQQRPVFVAGYPKPAHIPPIDKDAEEIPTNPKNIPPLPSGRPTSNNKPQKLETFNNEGNDLPEVPNAPQNPKVHPSTLRPGQRFFILNGDQVFPGFAGLQPFTEDFYQRYPQQPFPNFLPTDDQFFKRQEDVNNVATNPLLRNPGTGGFVQNGVNPQINSGEKSTESQAGGFFKTHPLLEQMGQFRFSPPSSENIFQYRDDPANEAIIVEANFDDNISLKAGQQNADSEVVTVPTETETDPPGPSMAQAGPGAIALAGPGGVAGAAPRGTAIVGKGGLAVASPQATAVAGPKEEDKKKESKKPKSK